MRHALVFCILCQSAAGATLQLQDIGGPTTLPGHHIDPYQLPEGLVGTSPVVQIVTTLENYAPVGHYMANVNPGGVPTAVRNAMILGADINNDTHLLFDPSQVTVFDVVETPSKFSARVVFSAPIDALPADSPLWFLRSVNDETPGPIFGFFTTLTVTVSYQDGSTREFIGGIIPEPSIALLIPVGCGVAALRTRRRRQGGKAICF